MQESFPPSILISQIDFAKNYTFVKQNGVQLMHCFFNNVTILVYIILMRSEQAGCDKEDELVKEIHYYIFGNKKHDLIFVLHYMVFHWKELIAVGIRPSKQWVFYNGCTSQFKGAIAIYFEARYPSLMVGCNMRWNYFNSSHDKGIHYPLEAFLFHYCAIYISFYSNYFVIARMACQIY